MGFDDICNTGLVLGLSKQGLDNNNNNNNQKPKKPISSNFEPSLTLSLSGEPTSYQVISSTKIDRVNYEVCHDKKTNNSDLFRQAYSPHDSAVSSFSSGRVVKRERDITSDQEAEVEKVISSRASDEEDEDGPNSRKKLRLTKQQSSFLEESFKQHTTLNPRQKQALATQLNLRPRQVEVWFQNRRARTKLKQTEVDCELLKKCYETLTDENKRLQKELQELKALKLSTQPFYMHMPAATLAMCPSCERIGGGGGGDINASNTPFSMPPNSHFYNSFSNPSAAC